MELFGDLMGSFNIMEEENTENSDYILSKREKQECWNEVG